MADPTTLPASACNMPSLSLPGLPDPLELILQALASLGIQIPELPTIPLPAPFCPLD